MMRKLRLFLLLQLFIGVAFSQNYIFKQFSTDQGLPDKYIYSMVQDRDGFLWISTAKGLVTFDGQVFKKCVSANSQDDFIFSSAMDVNGDLWFGTFGGKIYTRVAGKTDLLALPLSVGTSINRLVASPNTARVYLVCNGKGLFSLQNNQLKLLLNTPDYIVNGLTELADGKILLSTSDGLVMYNVGTGASTKVEGFDSETGLLQCSAKAKNRFWLHVPGKGLFELEIKGNDKVNVLTSLTAKDASDFADLAFFFFDEENSCLFFTNAGEKLSVVNTTDKTLRTFTDAEYFGAANFIFKGRQKNIWVCTNGKGLYRLNRAEYDFVPGITESVYAISADNEGNMYFGTKNGILVRTASGQITNSISRLDGKVLGKVTALFFDRQKLWVGTQDKGLFVVNPASLKTEKINFSGIDNIGINSICGNPNNAFVQVNTNLDGAYLYEGYTLKNNFSVRNSLLHNNVYHSVRLNTGKIYYATHNTAFNFSIGDKLFEVSVRHNGLISDFNVFSKSSKEQLLAGTDGDGIYYLEDSVIRPFELNDHLESKYVTGLLFDKDDNLWIQQQYNIYEYYPNEKVLRKINFYNKGQLLFNPLAFYKSASGDLFFGCNNGVVKFNQASNNQSINYAHAYITGLTVNDSARNVMSPLELKSGKYNFRFDYSALGQKNSEDISFRYLLEGRDNTWSEPTKQRRVEFANLSEGNYTFKLVAVNSDGFVQKEVASYSFTINKPIWKHLWFWILSLLVLVITVILIVNWRTRSLRRAKADLERTVQQKTLEIRKEKETVEKNSKVIEIQNTEIKQSINYAKRIQEAILPVFETQEDYAPEMLIIYLPKDIVSGDFYWHAIKNNRFMLAACDCTGHGVPGAFMSLIGSTLLNKIVLDKGITDPEVILQEVDSEISLSLKQGSNEVRDGMDAAICNFDFKNNTASFSGARRPLWVYRKNNKEYSLTEYSPGKYPLGGFADVKDKNFVRHEFELVKGDVIYMCTDGITDQFDGENKRRISMKRFKEFLSGIVHLPFDEQDKEIRTFFNSWKQNTRQTDDVMFIGIRI